MERNSFDFTLTASNLAIFTHGVLIRRRIDEMCNWYRFMWVLQYLYSTNNTLTSWNSIYWLIEMLVIDFIDYLPINFVFSWFFVELGTSILNSLYRNIKFDGHQIKHVLSISNLYPGIIVEKYLTRSPR